MEDGKGSRLDFFLSHAPADKAWAEWIAWTLEADGFRVDLPAWAPAGSNWIQLMHAGVQDAARTIAVLSDDYLTSSYQVVWQAARAQDPEGAGQRLLPVRVSDCARPGLLAGIIGIDLFGIDEEEARRRLRQMIAETIEGRAKPKNAPAFPGNDPSRQPPPFPGIPAPDRPSDSHDATVTDLSAYRIQGAGPPDVTLLDDLIAELSELAELISASYSADGPEYVWTRLELNQQLADIESHLKQVTRWLARRGMASDLDTFSLRHSLSLYAGTAERFALALAGLEASRGLAGKRGMLARYEAAWGPLRDLLWQIHTELAIARRSPGSR